MVLKVYTDGGAKGNPGPAAIGIVIYKDGEQLVRYRENIGIATNNIAEYTAVIKALTLIRENASSYMLSVASIEFYSDSKLMVSQLNGFYKVKNAKIRELVFKIRILEQELKIPILYHYIPRSYNVLADKLVNNLFSTTLTLK